MECKDVIFSAYSNVESMFPDVVDHRVGGAIADRTTLLDRVPEPGAAHLVGEYVLRFAKFFFIFNYLIFNYSYIREKIKPTLVKEKSRSILF